MFFKLALRNSRRSRKENGLFFSALLVSVIAFYMILSLAKQDVMVFLSQVESVSVARILSMLPLFFGFTLVILFFLVYGAGRYQMERRSHEFGVCLMLGMSPKKLFALLVAENLGTSLLALAVGLPAGILCSEFTSLVVGRLVGLDLLDHTWAVSLGAVLGTALSFLGVNLGAALLLSGGTVRQEIGALLADRRETAVRAPRPLRWGTSLVLGLVGLGLAYSWAIQGRAWSEILPMGQTLLLGMLSTFLLFYGLRGVVTLLANRTRADSGLNQFTFRQIQEWVIQRSSSLAVSSLLILTAMCFFSAGLGTFAIYRNQEPRVVDFTFFGCYAESEMETEAICQEIQAGLEKAGCAQAFEELNTVRVDRLAGDVVEETGVPEELFHRESVIQAVEQLPDSEEKPMLLSHLTLFASLPHLIPVSDYNRILTAAGREPLSLEENQLAFFMDPDTTSPQVNSLLNQVLEEPLTVTLGTEPFQVVGPVQDVSFVADRAVTSSFALLVPDAVFDRWATKEWDVYVNGTLSAQALEGKSALSALLTVSRQLEKTDLQWESYLQTMGRAMVYQIPASYITVYLAFILLLAANTLLGVQFLMAQQESAHRYRTLLRLGADYERLCVSLRRQVNWYFGLPVFVAAVSSLIGVRSLLAGILSRNAQMDLPQVLTIGAIVTGLLVVIEWGYLSGVKRGAYHWLERLASPRREE